MSRAFRGKRTKTEYRARRQPANQYRVRSFLCSPLLLYLEIPAWSPVPGLFCSALSIARRLTRNRASPNRRVHNRIAAGLAATVKLALCGFCTTDTNNILAENRWSLANRVRLHESVFIREFPVSCVGVRFLISREPCHAGAFAPSALGYIVQNCFARRQPRENRESSCRGC